MSGEERYNTEGVPVDFSRQAKSFYTDNGLADILGTCAMNEDDEGRVEKTVGRVSMMVLFRRDSNGIDIDDPQGSVEAV